MSLQKIKRGNQLSLPMFFFIAAFSVTTGLMSSAIYAWPTFSTLKKAIIEYNLEDLERSLTKGSYRGEEGILRISPEVGRSFGLKVFMGQDYLDAMEFYADAENLFGKVIRAMTTKEKGKSPGEHLRNIGDLAIRYNGTLRVAREHMAAYRLKLTQKTDDRSNNTLCANLLEELLQESIKRSSFNLRDALGYFYNRCQKLDDGNGPLNFRNVRFVNYVFDQFIKNAPEDAKKQFDLDRCRQNKVAVFASGWRRALGSGASRYITFIETLSDNHKGIEYAVDVFLFLALMRQESNFNPKDVSSVGAVGLTQIMPKTARALGMENVFLPSYFEKAGFLMQRERNLRRKAKSIILEINEQNKLELAGRARALLQESSGCRRQRTRLFEQYKQAVLEMGTDDRLDPYKAIEYGYKYFVRMMMKNKGDISLALASYNAGPHRVRQYNGIPPFAETVTFRNRVLRYYRDYLERMESYRASHPR